MITIAAAAVLLGAGVQDERINIPPSEVPQEVVELVKRFLPEGSITEATKRVRDDEEEYRLRIFVSGKIVEAEFDVEAGEPPEGKIEETVSRADVPSGVAEALARALPEGAPSKGRKVTEIDKNVPEAQVTYEWRLRDPKRHVVISPDGATTRIYQRIADGELPQAVRDTLAKEYAQTAFKHIDKITVNGQVSYHLEVQGADDLLATPDGKVTVEDK